LTGPTLAKGRPWRVAGPYVEACNCDAICPCRSVGGREGKRATYQLCQFAIAWTVRDGHFSNVDLSDQGVVMAGYWDEDEAGAPWRVVLYVDAKASDEQSAALADIFLGRAGGTPSSNYAGAIRDVLAIRRARIEIDHKRAARASRSITDAAARRFASVTRSRSGHARPFLLPRQWLAEFRDWTGRAWSWFTR